MRDGGLGAHAAAAASAVEVDETYIGREAGEPKPKRGHGPMHNVRRCTLVRARSGSARSFHRGRQYQAKSSFRSSARTFSREPRVMTDEASWYRSLRK